jgi:4-amino-4-deoxy-L-arabinose transferase-like glycosyltransferase
LNEPPRPPRLARHAAIVAAASAILFCLFSHLGAIGLIGPDEPRYAWIAHAMAKTGDWVTPRLYGQPWFEKPVLYYWAAALGFRAHLSPEWAARLPSAFAALAAALAIAWLGWKHYASSNHLAENPAILAPLLFSTSVAAIGFARAAAPDMLFSATLTLAMAGAATLLRHARALRSADEPPLESPRRDALPLAMFGVSLGLAVLAKGPAAIILAGGAIGLWALATNRWRAAIRLAHPLAIATCCVVALPWYILCAHRNPGFIRIFIFQHNFERYLTPMFQHRQPVWFFLPIILLGLLPWTPLLCPAAQEGLRLWRTKSWNYSPGFFFACWAVFPLFFFSFSQSKLPGYILPAIPPLALLCAIRAIRAFERSRAHAAFLGAAIGAMWLALVIFAFHLARRISWENYNDAYTPEALHLVRNVALAAAVLVALALTLAGYRRKFAAVVCLTVACVVITLEAASLRILPAIDAFYSARSHAEMLRYDRRPDRIFTYHLKRSWEFGLAFYFERQIPEWSPGDPDAALVLTTPDGFREIANLGRFTGVLDEPYVGILYVPVAPSRRAP